MTYVQEAIQEQVPVQRSSSNPAPRVLLVDAEEGIRAVVQEMLEGRGFAVVASRSGPTALKLLEDFPGPIDLLLTDIHVPRMAGPELARRARLLRPEMKVLYMSASGGEVPSSAQIEPDPQILAKPFSSEVLDQRVRRALRQ